MTNAAFADAGRAFCESTPHRELPYSKRNWGGLLHSLCSYQGKLKPSIAHFLIREFTQAGERVLDPMSGVGTIPLEARLQGRIGLAGDLSPLAYAVSTAKVVPTSEEDVWRVFADVKLHLESSQAADVDMSACEFGLNRPIREYFHPQSLTEVLLTRDFFLRRRAGDVLAPEDAVVLTAVMHILHGNRPYALSRRSHPITPFAPTGEFEYRSLLGRLRIRLDKMLPALAEMNATSATGETWLSDFRKLPHKVVSADAVITSPPFASSLRFWSSNWMRLWFAGWTPDMFKTEPQSYLETEQKASYSPYAQFADAMAALLPSGGRLILHLGETASGNMADSITPHLLDRFQIEHIGRECVADTETHGLSDKGATVAHWYLFATCR